MFGETGARQHEVLRETSGGRPGEEARTSGREAVEAGRTRTTATQRTYASDRVCIVQGAYGVHYHPIGCFRWSHYISDDPERRERHWLTQANKQFSGDGIACSRKYVRRMLWTN